jgi:hypothetical protein
MSYGSKRWLPSSHYLGYMEVAERRNYPYYNKLECTPPKGLFGNSIVAPLDGCPATANFLSLDASLALPTRVLRFKASGSRHRTPVRLVSFTGQTEGPEQRTREGGNKWEPAYEPNITRIPPQTPLAKST